MTLRTFAWLLRQSLLSTLDDGCFGYAKAAAYSALLSFFPVLTSAATILVQTRAEFVAATLESFLNQIVPPGTEDLVVQQFRVMGERPSGFLIGAGVVSLWAASGVIKSLIEGFQAAYRVPRNRDFFHQSGVAMSLVLLSAIPLVCASLLIVFGGQVERVVLNWMKVDPFLTPFAWVWQGASRHRPLHPRLRHHHHRHLHRSTTSAPTANSAGTASGAAPPWPRSCGSSPPWDSPGTCATSPATT